MAAYLPPGWPAGVHPPGSEGFERTAVAWLLDVVPPDYRLYGVLRRHPVALAAMAKHHVAACVEGARNGYRTARTDLGDRLPPPGVEAVLAAYRKEGKRLVATARAVDLILQVLRAEAPQGELQRGEAVPPRAARNGSLRPQPVNGRPRPQPSNGRPRPQPVRAEIPHADTPPAEAPPAEAPPAEAPRAEIPHADTPPAEAPPAEAPRAQAAGGEAPQGKAAPGKPAGGKPAGGKAAAGKPAGSKPARGKAAGGEATRHVGAASGQPGPDSRRQVTAR